MKLITASAAISYVTEVEEKSAKLYEDLAQRYQKERETFLAIAKENRQNRISIERAYYEVITDAFEAGFCLEDVDTENYGIKTELPKYLSYPDALKKLIELEEKTKRFQLDVSRKIGSLLPDVSVSFQRVGNRRTARIEKLRTILGK